MGHKTCRSPLGGLACVGEVERFGKKGKRLAVSGMSFEFADQKVDKGFAKAGASVMYSGDDGMPCYGTIDQFDAEAGDLVLMWNDKAKEAGAVPTSLVLNDWVSPKPKPESLGLLADQVLDPRSNGSPNPVSMALLRRDLPTFLSGHGPVGGVFDDDLESILDWVGHLDGSYVAIQGPPGTGKTYNGAHIIHALIKAGKRVGVTAMSHAAINNLVSATIDVFKAKGDLGLLTAVQKGKEPESGALPGVSYARAAKSCAKPGPNLVAGTTWLFAGNDMADAPVDVLIVDEAGQLALADALAASRSAGNLILLGDPLQLAQVSQASHPGRGGDSVLEHVLGDEETMPVDRGVFLSETRRMHPDVCGFISDEIYQGRLSSHESCAVQDTDDGTGLRWLQVEHTGCSTESPEEADAVAMEIVRLIDTSWTDVEGVKRVLTVKDFMVVAPYNDQVDLIRSRLDDDDRTSGVRIGTVDKFQGGEAPVVFYTMTSSGALSIKRGPSFLFSRHRLNVAISRARCLAYLVCAEELVNSRAGDVAGMRLLSTLCAFVEQREAPTSASGPSSGTGTPAV